MEEQTVALNSSTDASLTHSRKSPSTLNTFQEPFLNFDPKSELSFEEKSAIYCSLVALVETDYPFDNALQDRVVMFLKSLGPEWEEYELIAKLIRDLVPSSAGSPSGFVNSILTLLSSPHSTVVAAALFFLYQTTRAASSAIREGLVESDIVSKVLVTVQPQTLPIAGNEKIIAPLLIIIAYCVDLASLSSLVDLDLTTPADRYNHREMVFQKVVLPSSQLMTFLISDRYLLSGKLLYSFMDLLAIFIDIGPLHRPTLEFVLASPIVMACLSCLSFGEGDFDLWVLFGNLNQSRQECEDECPEVVQFGKRMMQALISEGFEDTLEQILMHNKGGNYGFDIVRISCSIAQKLGSNVEFTEWSHLK
ncbi:hypothetical protein BLNAU_7222 [Blattamonas nauphoetae]|uniref:Uncharacterized protein n=1 Tax=Blattamonas nauphoetae TaxID=2049346 RepID=A0ABQ9Y264_9EUKA|nr:hypothetical protein BLNAU_7222 [Blattamonas nauphoetae]